MLRCVIACYAAGHGTATAGAQATAGDDEVYEEDFEAIKTPAEAQTQDIDVTDEVTVEAVAPLPHQDDTVVDECLLVEDVNSSGAMQHHNLNTQHGSAHDSNRQSLHDDAEGNSNLAAEHTAVDTASTDRTTSDNQEHSQQSSSSEAPTESQEHGHDHSHQPAVAEVADAPTHAAPAPTTDVSADAAKVVAAAQCDVQTTTVVEHTLLTFTPGSVMPLLDSTPETASTTSVKLPPPDVPLQSSPVQLEPPNKDDQLPATMQQNAGEQHQQQQQQQLNTQVHTADRQQQQQQLLPPVAAHPVTQEKRRSRFSADQVALAGFKTHGQPLAGASEGLASRPGRDRRLTAEQVRTHSI